MLEYEPVKLISYWDSADFDVFTSDFTPNLYDVLLFTCWLVYMNLTRQFIWFDSQLDNRADTAPLFLFTLVI